MEDFRRIADAVAADIASGRLAAGDQLPPQRRFARRHQIAVSTATRVYRELARRGLTVGEVGRGTFVRAGRQQVTPALSEPADARVDLELIFAMAEGQAALMARALAGMVDPAGGALQQSLRPVGTDGFPAARAAVAAMLARPAWRPEPSGLLFAGSGRQAVAACLGALAGPGARVGVEPLTYPVAVGVARRLGLDLVPLEIDEDGITPDGVRRAQRATPMRAIYLQPTLHNPLGLTMSDRRRGELAATLDELDLFAVEDGISGFLDDATPLAAWAPHRVFHVDSMSKRLAVGLTVGVIVAPAQLREQVAAAVRTGGWLPSRFALEAATRWIGDGTVEEVVAAKRADARARQVVVAEALAGFDLDANPGAYHCWWRLPAPWRADTFVAAAARRGIAVTPAAAFTVVRGQAPDAVRLAVAAPPPDVLREALGTLAALARSSAVLDVE